jgi:hypothetical protein
MKRIACVLACVMLSACGEESGIASSPQISPAFNNTPVAWVELNAPDALYHPVSQQASCLAKNANGALTNGADSLPPDIWSDNPAMFTASTRGTGVGVRGVDLVPVYSGDTPIQSNLSCNSNGTGRGKNVRVLSSPRVTTVTYAEVPRLVFVGQSQSLGITSVRDQRGSFVPNSVRSNLAVSNAALAQVSGLNLVGTFPGATTATYTVCTENRTFWQQHCRTETLAIKVRNPAPQAAASVENGWVRLSWGAQPGVNTYRVYRKCVEASGATMNWALSETTSSTSVLLYDAVVSYHGQTENLERPYFGYRVASVASDGSENQQGTVWHFFNASQADAQGC